MQHRTSARLVSVLLLIIAALLPGAAHAERVVTEDASGDAEAWSYEQDLQLVPAPQEASVDITRTVASLGERRLSVTVRFRDLEVRPVHDLVARLRTPRTTFDVIATREGASRATIELTNPRDEAFSCRGLRVRYDGGADLVRLSVPTTCIGSPRWVRLGVKSTASPTVGAQTAVVLYADDALRGGGSDKTVRLGARIHRG